MKIIEDTRDDLNKSIKIGQTVHAKLINGENHKGEIVCIREKNKKNQYLVHFNGMNRRLDAWYFEEELKLNIETDKILNNSKSANSVHEITTNLHRDTNSFNKDISMDDGKNKKMTRLQKRLLNENNQNSPIYEFMDPTTAALEREHEEVNKIKYIEYIEIGFFEIVAWYFSPYPGRFCKVHRLYICENCLKYMDSEEIYFSHLESCIFKLFGNIYNKNDLKIYEIDGNKNKLYCQNLCLLSKLFLDHKTLYYDVAHFNFYILFECDEYGDHIAGYFSKEKSSLENFNLSCIMVLPPYQRKGFGKFLIALSYEISKLEHKIGSPEKPLSDLGRISYKSYWGWLILQFLKENRGYPITLNDLSLKTFIKVEDIIFTLQPLGLVKYWKGEHVLCATLKMVEQVIASGYIKPPKIVPDPNYISMEYLDKVN